MTRARGGSGLGLSITRQLVELMGGTVSMESEVGQGSCFRFTTRCKAAPHGEQPPHPRQHLPRTLRALVLDGNAASSLVISVYLANWQIDAQVVHTISEAETALAAGGGADGPFDVAILDMKCLGSRAPEFVRAVRATSGKRPIELVLLVSLDTFVSDTSLDRIGAAAILPKPVRPSELFNALVSIASNGTACNVAARSAREGKQTTQTKYTARILVAEDNAVNQEVALGMLEALGCHVVSASNGQIAAQLFAKEQFDLILMDCEMPVMDGIAATRRIRELEAASLDRSGSLSVVRPRIPIIALTAHALSDVRDKCFSAGMDGFLIKPFDEQQLADTLSPWCAPSKPADEHGGKADDAPAGTAQAPANIGSVIDMSVLDRLRALTRPNGNSPLGRAVACFVDVAPSLAQTMRASFESGDAEELWRAAHSLKSSSGALGVTQLAKHCAQIEALARQSNVAAVRPLMEDLDHGVTAAIERLQAIAKEMHVLA